MPAYPWFQTRKIDLELVPAKIRTLQRLGVPYRDGYDEVAVDELREQAMGIAQGLQDSGFRCRLGQPYGSRDCLPATTGNRYQSPAAGRYQHHYRATRSITLKGVNYAT